ncbi:MAG TPA: alpha-amylase family glycosyl hydrolase [Flavisolibacter sp.]
MKRLLLWCVLALSGQVSYGQLLTWNPPFPKENDAAQNLVITVDATKGNQGLLNYSPTGDVYVHIGVITNLSTTTDDWKHVLFTWGTTPVAAQAAYAGSNKWTYTISGSLRTFFNVTDPNEVILKIAILFRSGNGSRAQRNTDGSNMYVPVYTPGLHVRIDQPARQPKFVPVPEPQNWTIGSAISITANSSEASTMKLYHNGVLLATQTNVTTISSNSTVTVIGNQQLVAEASNGSVTRFDTLNIFVAPPASPTAALPAGVRDGINYEPGDTSVTLVLRAPGKNLATVIGDFNNWTQTAQHIMNRTPDGKFFWLRLHPLVPGTEYAYQFVVDDSIRIADPYTEKVLDPWNDQYISPATYPGLRPYPAGQTGIVSVLRTAEPAYNWTITNFSRPDKRGLVVYELLLRDFVAAHDWKTLTDSLAYLQRIGINAIELMPVNEFEGNISWGYNPSFYFAPDKYYGPKNAFKAFIDSCHRRGMAVIMDMTLNHSFGLSPMVQLYWDPANNRPSTSNPWYNPVAKHAFNVGFDMNHESLDTRYFSSRVMEHWLKEYKVDGFRFDLSKGFTQVQTCDASGNNCNVGAWGNYDASRIAIWKRYYDSVQNHSQGAYAILEHFADNSEEIELSNYGMMLWGNMHGSYANASKGIISGSDFSNAIHSSRGWAQPHLVSFMESHDEERIVHLNIKEGASSGSYNIKDTATALKRKELVAAFLFTIPGPKMFWQFGELGYDYPINYCPDGTVNNNCRLDPKPIRWDYLNDPRRTSVLNVFSKLINLRFHPWYREAFQSGNVNKSLSGSGKWIHTNSGDSSHLVVVGNFGLTQQAVAFTFPSAGVWFDYFGNSTFTATGGVQNISLQPGAYRVFLNRNVGNIPVTPVTNVPWTGNRMQAKVYPNPVSGPFVTEINLPQPSVVSADLFNAIGQHVLKVHDGPLARGSNIITTTQRLVPGIYHLQIRSASTVTTLQLTIQ